MESVSPPPLPHFAVADEIIEWWAFHIPAYTAKIIAYKNI